MASITIQTADWLADGVSLSVYPRSAWGPEGVSGAPSGSAADSATTASGQATFSALADNTRYVAYDSGAGRFRRFSTPPVAAGSAVALPLGPVLAQPVLDTGPAGGLTIAAGGTGVYRAFPGIAEMPNGKGISIWRKSSAESAGSPISLEVSYSTDTTWQTWTAPAQFLSVASRDLRDVGISVIGSRIYVTFFASTGTSTSRAHSEGYVYSDDNGATWSPYVDSMGPDTFTQYCRCSGPIVKAANGDLIWPIHGQNTGDGSNWTTAVLISHDNGATWPTQVTVFASGGTQNFQEMNVKLLHDGTTLLAAAKNLTDNLIYIATSTDNGATWTSLGGKMNGDGRAALDVDPDTGRVYCATRRPSQGRHVLYWSDDNGATWAPNPLAPGSTASGKTIDERPTPVAGVGRYAQMVRRASRPGEIAIVLGTELSGGSNSADITLRWLRTRGGSTPVGTNAPSGDTVIPGGRWNGAHEVIETPDGGNYHQWVDALGHPRFKLNAPTSDIDGSPLGLTRRETPFVAATPLTITDAPAAATEVPNTRRRVDLTGAQEYRFHCGVNVVGSAGSTLRVAYSTDGGTTWVTLTGTVTLTSVAPQKSNPTSGWSAVPAAAQAEVTVCLQSAGGDGVADPQIVQAVLETRSMA